MKFVINTGVQGATVRSRKGTSAALQTADAFFATRKDRGDKALALAFLRDGGGEEPRAEDRLPT
jgi:hypothetical protein